MKRIREIFGRLAKPALCGALVLCLLGCESLSGENGENGVKGPVGDTGPQGDAGLSVADSLPCAGCIERESIADASVDNRVLGAGAVKNTKLTTGSIGTDQFKPGSVTTNKLQGASIGSAQIADLAVTEVKIASSAVPRGALTDNAVKEDHVSLDSVLLNDIGFGAVHASYGTTSGAIAPAAVVDGNISFGAVLPRDGGTAGSIAGNAIRTRHISSGTFHHIWLKRGAADTSSSSTAWNDISEMSWSISQGSADAYLIFFNGSFSSYSSYGFQNYDFEVRLVEWDGSAVVRTLGRQSVRSLMEVELPYVPCTFFYDGLWQTCNLGHNHRYGAEAPVGSVTLVWAGVLDPSTNNEIKVQWRSNLPGHYIYQRPSSGDRVLGVVEFMQTRVDVVP